MSTRPERLARSPVGDFSRSEGKNHIEYRTPVPSDQLLAKLHSPPTASPMARPSVPTVAARGPTKAVSVGGSRSAFDDQESLTTTPPTVGPTHHSHEVPRRG